MASTYLTRTNTGTVTNTQKFTFSAWVKRSKISSGQNTLFAGYVNGTNNDLLYIPSGDTLGFWGAISGSQSVYYETNRVFRDTNAWYHIVLAVDTTQATASDRVKIYVNGVQETSFSSSTAPAQNVEFRLAKASNPQEIGSQNTTNNWDGLMSHIHFIDGTQYQASDFGETDATTGIWKPKTAPSVTYGTNGFFLKFENSGSMGTDSSPNGNNFIVNGNLTQTVDTPSNVYATFNPLWRARVNTIDLPTYMSNGNTTFNSQGDDTRLAYFASTLGVTSGKYYWEVKSESGSGGGLGVCYNNMQSNTNAQFWDNANLLGCAIKVDGNYFNGKSGENAGALGVTYSEDDIYGFALDMDNYALYAHINGTYVNSGVPTSGASRTGSLLNLLASGLAYLNSGEPVFPFFADLSAGSHAELKVNFGNGYFGTTPVASAGSNGNGAIFEFDCPTGYYALNTKNINTYG
jgi:hypothetical protein